MSGVSEDIYIAARRALLDALEALGDHADNVIVIGAQAIYMHTGAMELAIAELTKDADLALDPRGLSADPLVEKALEDAGFYPNPDQDDPGAWCSQDGMPVDLMVPEDLAGPPARNRRGGRIPPHSKRATRRAVGLEAVVVDNAVLSIGALDPADPRVVDAKVAGPAALLVAKLHKLGDRLDEPHRLMPKDAHDIYRLLRAIPTEDLAGGIGRLLDDPVSHDVTLGAMSLLGANFAASIAPGARMAGDAESGVGDPDQVQEATSILTNDLIDALGERLSGPRPGASVDSSASSKPAPDLGGFA